MTQLTPAQLIAAFVQLRDHRKAATEAFEQSLERTNAAMKKIEALLLDHLNKTGADSIACEDGTAYKNTQSSATVENRDQFKEFVEANGLWEAMDIRANKTFVREYMEHTGTPIPGIKFSSMTTIGVRRG